MLVIYQIENQTKIKNSEVHQIILKIQLHIKIVCLLWPNKTIKQIIK